MVFRFRVGANSRCGRDKAIPTCQRLELFTGKKMCVSFGESAVETGRDLTTSTRLQPERLEAASTAARARRRHHP